MDTIEILFKRHYRSLVFYAMQHVYDRSVAEDIVSDAFIKVLYASDINLRSFLYTVTYKACLDHIRINKIHDRIHHRIEYSQNEADEIENSYDYMYAEYITRLREALMKITPRRRTILLLYYQGYSTLEIAHQLDISEQTVRNLKTNAIKALRGMVCGPELPQKALLILLVNKIPLFNAPHYLADHADRLI